MYIVSKQCFPISIEETIEILEMILTTPGHNIWPNPQRFEKAKIHF